VIVKTRRYIEINVKRLKHNVKDNQIIRSKRQITNLLVIELILRGAHHGTARAVLYILTALCGPRFGGPYPSQWRPL
jgi:hypothetical protein